jgi:hypothetical protein
VNCECPPALDLHALPVDDLTGDDGAPLGSDPTRISSTWSGSHPPVRHAELAASLDRYNGLSLPPQFLHQIRGTTTTGWGDPVVVACRVRPSFFP